MPSQKPKAPALKFKFIKDEPVDSTNGSVFQFYHSSIAPALTRMLEDSSAPHTIGLFGSWGTGKSTIIAMLQKDAALKAPIFIFDAWKYQQEDALRRIFLTNLVEFINGQPDINCTISLDELNRRLYKPRSQTVAAQVTAEPANLPWQQKAWKWVKRNWLLESVSLSILAWILLQIFVKNNVYLVGFREVAKTVAGYSAAIYVLKEIWAGAISKAVSKLTEEAAVATELHTTTEFEDRLNSPEQFERLFKEIISQVDKKLIIVFDNIDRVQGDVAISMLSTIKTFLDPGHAAGLVFLIPCDSKAIQNQIAKYYESATAGDDFDPSEYLRKVFNLVIWVPEFISTDLEEYTKKELGETGDISTLLGNEDVVLVINAAFSKNPREIIQFINNLIAAVLVASQTEVWPLIEQNIPYLAKVLVLKQKFPLAYYLLKERWDEPENIISDVSENEGLKAELIKFMNLTDRISSNDAEPFIYFKTPVRSNQLKDSDGLRRALTNGSVEAVKDLIDKENNDEQVAEFVCDLLEKYKSQQRALMNIFVTHAAAFQERKVDIKKAKYYQTALRIIDQQLWQSHQDLPVDYVISLAINSRATKKLQSSILDRYIAVLDGADNAGAYVQSIFENLVGLLDQLSSDQKTRVREIVAAKYVKTDFALSIFKDRESQDDFVSKEAMQSFISNINETNCAEFIETLKHYKEFLIEGQLTEAVFSKLAETLNLVNTNKPGEIPPKTILIQSMEAMFSLYQKEQLKEKMGASADRLAEVLGTSFPQIPGWDERGQLVTCMFWIRHYPAQNYHDALVAQIRDYLANATVAGLTSTLEYWNESTRQNLIKENIASFLPRLGDAAILALVYENANDTSKIQIIEHLATLPASADVSFVSQLNTYPDKAAFMRILITKAGNIAYNLREPYYEFLAAKLNSRDEIELKDMVIAQAKALLRTDDPQSQKVGYDLVTRLKLLNETYKRDIGKDVLDWLKQPGRPIAANQEYAFKTLAFIYVSLQEPPQNEIVYMLFNLLTDAHDAQTIKVALETLDAIKPRYLKYPKDFEDAAARLQAMPNDDQRKPIIREGLLTLRSARPGVKEVAFWDRVQGTERPDTEVAKTSA